MPIPPDLVTLLRWHLVAYGAAPDGRLFRTQRGGLIQDTGYGEVWAEGPRASPDACPATYRTGQAAV